MQHVNMNRENEKRKWKTIVVICFYSSLLRVCVHFHYIYFSFADEI